MTFEMNLPRYDDLVAIGKLKDFWTRKTPLYSIEVNFTNETMRIAVLEFRKSAVLQRPFVKEFSFNRKNYDFFCNYFYNLLNYWFRELRAEYNVKI